LEIPYLVSGLYRISWIHEAIGERVALSFYLDQTGSIHPIASRDVSSVQLELLGGYEMDTKTRIIDDCSRREIVSRPDG